MNENPLESPPPDAIVARRIIQLFQHGKLLPHELAISLSDQLAEGTMKEEDWRLLAEKALALEERTVTV